MDDRVKRRFVGNELERPVRVVSLHRRWVEGVGRLHELPARGALGRVGEALAVLKQQVQPAGLIERNRSVAERIAPLDKFCAGES